jgi:hypothetical protein
VITETSNRDGAPAITSDRWHLVHARFTRASRKRPFARGIVSEHADRAECLRAAREMRAKLAALAGTVPLAERDVVFARPPNFKSLQRSKARRPRLR